MADEKFDIKKFLTGFINPTTWSKTVVYMVIAGCILFILFCIKNTFFPNKSITNKPHAVAIGKVEAGAIDQRSTNIVVEKEKPFEVGAGVGAGRYDDKDAYGGMIWGKYKW